MLLSQKTQRDIVTSFSSSVISVVACSPLEVLKMNAQVTSANVTVKGLFKDIYKSHGIQGFYKGLGVSVLAQPSYWACYWPIYNTLKVKFQNPGGDINLHTKMGIIFGSSLVSSMAVNPLFVFKTRFQTSVLKKNAYGSVLHPRLSYATLISDIARKEGIRGFYKGNLVAQIKNTQMVLQMPLFDYFNSSPNNPLGKSNFVLLDRSFVSGVLAKSIASCLIYYPIDSIRTNIRDNIENKSILQITRQIYARPGGVLNFYRGVGIYWISSVPAFGVLMYFFDKFEKNFG